MTTPAERIFAQAHLYTDDAEYLLIHAPARAIMAAAGIIAEVGEPFSVLIADKDEVTLVIAASVWDDFAHRLPDHKLGGTYRLITFDQPLEPDLLGFFALVGQILAEAGVSILALSAFARDHVLVQSGTFPTAWDALHTAQARLS